MAHGRVQREEDTMRLPNRRERGVALGRAARWALPALLAAWALAGVGGGCNSTDAQWPGWVEPERPALLIRRGDCPADSALTLTDMSYQTVFSGLQHADCIEIAHASQTWHWQVVCDATGAASRTGDVSPPQAGVGCRQVVATVAY